MDELADILGMHPIELRIRNEPARDPERGVPFSDRMLVDCLRDGARRFGWERRPARPATLRDAQWLVGYGMAAAIRAHPQGPAKARARMGTDGIAVVQTDMTDIGTGTYTILTQVAAEALDLPIDRVRVDLGHSGFPASWGSGGSWGACSSSVAVRRACQALREKLRRAGDPGGDVEAEGEVVAMTEDPNYRDYSIRTYGAQFAEVGVDADTAEIRLRRMLGVFAPGRVLNAKTARSQLIGAMTFGVGLALLEEGVVDPRDRRVHQPRPRAVPGTGARRHPRARRRRARGFDDKANVLGAKGLGELGNCGAAAAVANAVFNATGTCVCDYPIRLDKILRGIAARG